MIETPEKNQIVLKTETQIAIKTCEVDGHLPLPVEQYGRVVSLVCDRCKQRMRGSP